jgi:hypothetical protein
MGSDKINGDEMMIEKWRRMVGCGWCMPVEGIMMKCSR